MCGVRGKRTRCRNQSMECFMLSRMTGWSSSTERNSVGGNAQVAPVSASRPTRFTASSRHISGFRPTSSAPTPCNPPGFSQSAPAYSLCLDMAVSAILVLPSRLFKSLGGGTSGLQPPPGTSPALGHEQRPPRPAPMSLRRGEQELSSLGTGFVCHLDSTPGRGPPLVGPEATSAEPVVSRPPSLSGRSG